MSSHFLAWFSNLPFALQCIGYVLALPFASAAVGVVICLTEDSASSMLEEHGKMLGLIMLGAMSSIYFGSIFGATFLFYKFLHLPYWLSFVIGLVFGLVVVPASFIFIADKRSKS